MLSESLDFTDVDFSISKVSPPSLWTAKFKLKLGVVFSEPVFLWIFKEFHQMNVVEQVKCTEAGKIWKCPFTLDFLMYDSKQYINDECTPDLYFDGIFIVSMEEFKWEVLSELLEQEFYLPSFFVNQYNMSGIHAE